MRKNWKRILSILLCAAMVFTMDTSVFAEENVSGNAAEAVQEKETAQNAADVASADAVSKETEETVSDETVSDGEEPAGVMDNSKVSWNATTIPGIKLSVAKSDLEVLCSAQETDGAAEPTVKVYHSDNVFSTGDYGSYNYMVRISGATDNMALTITGDGKAATAEMPQFFVSSDTSYYVNKLILSSNGTAVSVNLWNDPYPQSPGHHWVNYINGGTWMNNLDAIYQGAETVEKVDNYYYSSKERNTDNVQSCDKWTFYPVNIEPVKFDLSRHEISGADFYGQPEGYHDVADGYAKINDGKQLCWSVKMPSLSSDSKTYIFSDDKNIYSRITIPAQAQTGSPKAVSTDVTDSSITYKADEGFCTDYKYVLSADKIVTAEQEPAADGTLNFSGLTANTSYTLWAFRSGKGVSFNGVYANACAAVKTSKSESSTVTLSSKNIYYGENVETIRKNLTLTLDSGKTIDDYDLYIYKTLTADETYGDAVTAVSAGTTLYLRALYHGRTKDVSSDILPVTVQKRILTVSVNKIFSSARFKPPVSTEFAASDLTVTAKSGYPDYKGSTVISNNILSCSGTSLDTSNVDVKVPKMHSNIISGYTCPVNGTVSVTDSNFEIDTGSLNCKYYIEPVFTYNYVLEYGGQRYVSTNYVTPSCDRDNGNYCFKWEQMSCRASDTGISESWNTAGYQLPAGSTIKYWTFTDASGRPAYDNNTPEAYQSASCDSAENFYYYYRYFGSTNFDFYLHAVVSTKAADSVYMESIAPVEYAAREHVAAYDVSKNTVEIKADPKSTKAHDLEIVLHDVSGDSGSDYRLVQGKDFTVTYRNNVNASVKVNDDGTYTELTDNKNRWPAAVIKGQGRYSTLDIKAYFDIVPRNFEDDTTAVDAVKTTNYAGDGVTLLRISKAFFSVRPKEVYRLGNKNKGISLSYRVAYQYTADRDAQMASNYRTVTLKRNSDYSGELYLVTKVNGVEKYTEVNSAAAVTEPGTYELRVRGINNFTGRTGDGDVRFLVIAHDAKLLSDLKPTATAKSWCAAGVAADSTGFNVRFKRKFNGRKLVYGTDYTVTMSYNDEAVSKAASAGTYMCRITPQGDLASAYPGQTVTVRAVLKGAGLKGKISLKWQSKVYTGETFTQSIKTRLTKGTDYRFWWQSADGELPENDEQGFQKAGTYYLSVQGLGKYYTGKNYILPFTIKGAKLTVSAAGADAAECNVCGTYTTVRVKTGDGTVTLTGRADSYTQDGFAVKYSANRKAGTGKIKITATDDNKYYSGSVTIPFTINKVNVTRIFSADCYAPDAGKYQAGAFYASVEDAAAKRNVRPKVILMQASVDGSRLGVVPSSAYTTENVSAELLKDNAVKISSRNNASFTAVGVQADDTFLIYTRKVNVQVKLADAAQAKKGFAFTGHAIKPAVSVKVNGRAYDGSCQVSYTNNTDTGRATVTVRLTAPDGSEYAVGGTGTATFRIVPQKSSSMILSYK